MGIASKDFWVARKKAADAGQYFFDVTRGWNAQQRNEETARMWSFVKPLLTRSKRVIDWGCGPGRFRPFIEQADMEWMGVDILSDFAVEGKFWLYEDGKSIPPELDGDCVFCCLVIQHLGDGDVIRVLEATTAERVIIVDGVWKSDGYSTARTFDQYVNLMMQAGFSDVEFWVHQTPFVKYKVLRGKRGDAS